MIIAHTCRLTSDQYCRLFPRTLRMRNKQVRGGWSWAYDQNNKMSLWEVVGQKRGGGVGKDCPLIFRKQFQVSLVDHLKNLTKKKLQVKEKYYMNLRILVLIKPEWWKRRQNFGSHPKFFCKACESAYHHVTYHKLIIVSSFVFTHFRAASETLKRNQWLNNKKDRA